MIYRVLLWIFFIIISFLITSHIPYENDYHVLYIALGLMIAKYVFDIIKHIKEKSKKRKLILPLIFIIFLTSWFYNPIEDYINRESNQKICALLLNEKQDIVINPEDFNKCNSVKTPEDNSYYKLFKAVRGIVTVGIYLVFLYEVATKIVYRRRMK